jgi:hypothetical protein
MFDQGARYGDGYSFQWALTCATWVRGELQWRRRRGHKQRDYLHDLPDDATELPASSGREERQYGSGNGRGGIAVSEH